MAPRLLVDPRQRFRALKYSIYALLAFNIYLFLVQGTVSEAIDSLGWLLLLGVFEWESTHLDRPYWSPLEKAALWGVQGVAYALMIYALYRYIADEEWLDIINATLWLMVVAMLVYDVYAPGRFGAAEWRIRNAIKISLYAALFVVAVIWGIRGDALDFFDAALWLLCFFMVELNVFNFERHGQGRRP